LADRELDNHEKKCKICGELKKRIRGGSFTKKAGSTPKWLGEDGKLWNGLVCGKCHIKQCVARQFIKRASRAE